MQAKEVALDHRGGAERHGVDGFGQALARAPGLVERLGPAPEEADHLGAVEEAVAAVEHELLLGGAPPRERVGPGAAALEVEELRAGVDHRAVGVAGRQRRELAGLDRHHGPVEQCHPLGQVAEVDEHAALGDGGERGQLAVGVPGGDLARLHEVGVGAGEVTGLEHPQHAEPVLEVALLHAVDAGLRRGGRPPRSTQPRQRAMSPMKPSASRDPGAEVGGPVHRSLVQAALVGEGPGGEGVVVRGR